MVRWYGRRGTRAPARISSELRSTTAGRSSVQSSGRTPPRYRGPTGHMAQQLAHSALEISAMHNRVEHSMIEEELRRLKAVGQVLPKGLFDDAWSGEPDHRAGLGEDSITKHGVTRAHASGRGIRENGDVRNATLGKHGEDGRHFRHLHQRENALLHSRAAGCRDDNQWELPLQRALSEACDLLSHHGAHGTAHEGEVHDTEIDRQPIEQTVTGEERVGVACVRKCLLQPLRVLREAERIRRAQVYFELLHCPVVEQQRAVLVGTNPTMIIATRAHVEVALELLANVGVSARLAFFPNVGRDFEPISTRLTRFLLLSEPCHGRKVRGNGARWKWEGLGIASSSPRLAQRQRGPTRTDAGGRATTASSQSGSGAKSFPR